MSDKIETRKNDSNRLSRFRFESDHAPLELQRLEEESRRKRDEFRSRIRAIDDRIAKWTSLLTKECLDRDAVNADILDRSVHSSLEHCMTNTFHQLDHELINPVFSLDEEPCEEKETISTQEHQTKSQKTSLPILEKQIMAVEQDFLTFQHETIFGEQNRNLLPIQRYLAGEMGPHMRIECTKADKREGSLVRTFEAMVAKAEREILEEQITTKTDLSILKKQYEKVCSAQERQTNDFLNQIADIRQLLKKETMERQKQDQLTVNRIFESQQQLQKIVLESMTGSKIDVNQ